MRSGGLEESEEWRVRDGGGRGVEDEGWKMRVEEGEGWRARGRGKHKMYLSNHSDVHTVLRPSPVL